MRYFTPAVQTTTDVSPTTFISNADASRSIANLFWAVNICALDDRKANGGVPWLENCMHLADVERLTDAHYSLATLDPFTPYMDPWRRDIIAGGLTSYPERLDCVTALIA